MSKKIVLIIIVFLLLIANTSHADNLETISFMSPRTSDWKITLKGYFSKNGFIAPGETIFSVDGRSTFVSWTGQKSSAHETTSYLFTGRTGDKTFEMERRYSSIFIKKIISNKVNMYLDDSLYNLTFPPFEQLSNTNCTKEDKVFLKMIKLEGNQLEYQIILPDCLNQK